MEHDNSRPPRSHDIVEVLPSEERKIPQYDVPSCLTILLECSRHSEREREGASPPLRRENSDIDAEE